MKLDLLEVNTFRYTAFISFFLFLFLPLELSMKIFLFGISVYFVVLFFLGTYWSQESHPELRFIIGFWVSTFHTFLFLLGGFFSFVLATIILKFFPFLSRFFSNLIQF